MARYSPIPDKEEVDSPDVKTFAPKRGSLGRKSRKKGMKKKGCRCAGRR